MSFLRTLFGSKAAPAANAPSPRSAAEAPLPHLSSEDPETLVLREEILDARNRLCGYRFSPRPSGVVVQESAYWEALQALRVRTFAERRPVFIRIGMDAVVFQRHLGMLAPHAYFVLDVTHEAADPDKITGRLAALRGAGARTAVSGVRVAMAESPGVLSFLAEADLVVLHMADPRFSGLPGLIATLRQQHPALQIAVEGVHQWEERRLCASWGVDYCLGDFISRPDDAPSSTGLDQGKLTAIALLNLLRNDAEDAELAETAKRDPGATFQLLKWANSSALGLTTRIGSLQQAIMVLGREQLVRWLTVSLFRKSAQRERDEALLEIALARARFLETLPLAHLGRAQRDELFIVGMMSVFDALLSMPMAKVLDHMQLSPAVQDVLLRSDGPYSRYLMLLLTLERGSAQQVAARAEVLDTTGEALAATRQAAFDWAQQALSGTYAE